MGSIFNVFGAAVNSHWFSNTLTRWSYVSLLAPPRLVNHSTAPLLYAILFFKQLILSFSVVCLCSLILFSISLRNWPSNRLWSGMQQWVLGSNEGSCCGAGDVAGVSLRDGVSENEMDDGLEGGEEHGGEVGSCMVCKVAM
jgi:hypothetical protein